MIAWFSGIARSPIEIREAQRKSHNVVLHRAFNPVDKVAQCWKFWKRRHDPLNDMTGFPKRLDSCDIHFSMSFLLVIEQTLQQSAEVCPHVEMPCGLEIQRFCLCRCRCRVSDQLDGP